MREEFVFGGDEASSQFEDFWNSLRYGMIDVSQLTLTQKKVFLEAVDTIVMDISNKYLSYCGTFEIKDGTGKDGTSIFLKGEPKVEKQPVRWADADEELNEIINHLGNCNISESGKITIKDAITKVLTNYFTIKREKTGVSMGETDRRVRELESTSPVSLPNVEEGMQRFLDISNKYQFEQEKNWSGMFETYASRTSEQILMFESYWFVRRACDALLAQ